MTEYNKLGRRKRKEKKDAPLPLLLKPSVKTQFYKICAVNDKSMNETINELLLGYIKKNKVKIKEFDKTHKDIEIPDSGEEQDD